ncbi:MAG: adenosine deaminase [Methanoculleus sp. SDB]|nr:MAG: adenosine deaminase [Methanoculleus sp. SDB]
MTADALISVALGERPADLVCHDVSLFNPFSCEWEETSFAVAGGRVAGIGAYEGIREIRFGGAQCVPGLIDAHVHIESSLLTPVEYGRLVLGHGTTTVVADPHEIANVAGTDGLDYMLAERKKTPLDILLMLPSCVPATPMDRGGATLTAEDLSAYTDREGILGLGEMMNVPGVLSGDPGVAAKMSLCRIIDGHAPLLSGHALNAYIGAGAQSDHECTNLTEAREKLRRGMYIMIREGSTERNLRDLIPLITPATLSRLCFATDDRHADMLVAEGHIDDCIRKAVGYGCEPEHALRMATLSAAERFGLADRGAVAPGRIADFCILEDGKEFRVARTFRAGVEFRDPGYTRPASISRPFSCTLPVPADLTITKGGNARVIRLLEHQILTGAEEIGIAPGSIPDTERDILPAVVCDRYRASGFGIGLVQGLHLKSGAIASSVSHDSHNIVAAGADTADILKAVGEVIDHKGGMAAVNGDSIAVLPLPCAGLMSDLPYEEVARRIGALEQAVAGMGGIAHPFMYLSFLALTVIPHRRLTERGVFDADRFEDISLFSGEDPPP